MSFVTEGGLTFSFSASWRVESYDRWPFYKNGFKDACGGTKAVDIVALDTGAPTLWLIEVKDYRQHRRKKAITVWDEMAVKARDTLAGLAVARIDIDHPDTQVADTFLHARRVEIVLHFEQPVQQSKLFPRAFDLADVQQKLRQITKPIDAHPRVVDLATCGAMPWTVTSP